ncbi:MAG: hypothetical protein Q4C70_00620 [Planctomycetia bacterium]|nr:hypothetical protein [Planctomycetia bacterium]
MEYSIETIRFLAPNDFATEEMLQTIHMLALDRTMIPVEAELVGNELRLHYPDLDNLRFCVPWTIPNVGNKMLTTGTLLATDKPYFLSLELARGMCVSVRNQAADWETAGLTIEPEITQRIQEAGTYLFHAIKLAYHKTEYDPEVDKYSNYVMTLCTQATLLLVKAYIERVLRLRKIAKQSADAAIIAMSGSQPLALQDDLLENDELFDEDSVTHFLAQLDQAQSRNRDMNSSGLGDSFHDGFYDAFDDSDDISGDDTAVHIIEAVPPKYVGVNLGARLLGKQDKNIFFETCNHIIIDTPWRLIHEAPEHLQEYDSQIEWAESNGFSVSVGPLLNFSPNHLPDYLMRMNGDYDAICHEVREHVAHIVKRYRSKVSTWIASSRVNTFFPFGLTLLQQLELTGKIVTWIHEFHPTAEVFTSLDMPWGDNVLPPPFGAEDEEGRIYPTIVCADYLLRSKCKVDGFQLEFNIGYRKRATYDRPIVDWSRMIDRWSHFGVPLYLQVRVPSSCEPDPLALNPEPPLWSGWTPRYQALWASHVLPVLLAKPNVYGIDWCVFRDSRPHDYPNAGLIDRNGQPKRVQQVLSEMLKYFMADMDL